MNPFVQNHLSNHRGFNPSPNSLLVLLNLSRVHLKDRLEDDCCIPVSQLKGVSLSDQSEKRIGGYHQGNKSSPNISSPSHQVHVSVSAAEGSWFSTWNCRSAGKLLVALLNSINLLIGTTEETKYEENKRRGWAKLIERDPFTGSPAILISSPEKQIGTSKLLLKNSFSTLPLPLSRSLLGVRGWKIPVRCWQWGHYYDKHLHFIYWSAGDWLASSSTALARVPRSD